MFVNAVSFLWIFLQLWEHRYKYLMNEASGMAKHWHECLKMSLLFVLLSNFKLCVKEGRKLWNQLAAVLLYHWRENSGQRGKINLFPLWFSQIPLSAVMLTTFCVVLFLHKIFITYLNINLVFPPHVDIHTPTSLPCVVYHHCNIGVRSALLFGYQLCVDEVLGSLNQSAGAHQDSERSRAWGLSGRLWFLYRVLEMHSQKPLMQHWRRHEAHPWQWRNWEGCSECGSGLLSLHQANPSHLCVWISAFDADTRMLQETRSLC